MTNARLVSLPLPVGKLNAQGEVSAIDECFLFDVTWVFPKIGVPPNHPF